VSALLLFGLMKVFVGLAVSFQSLEIIQGVRMGLIQNAIPIHSLALVLSRRSLIPFRYWKVIFSDRLFVVIQVLRIVAVMGLLFPAHFAAAAQLGLALSIVTLFRFLGAFNGGSDAMTLVCFTGLCLGAVKPEWGLYWVGVQSVLSYFLSGMRKAFNPSWWNGRALRVFLDSSVARASGVESWLNRDSQIFRWTSAGVVIFQVGFPVWVFFPEGVNLALILGAGFHFANFLFFGLNRFFWIWIASYPAILFLSKLAQV